MCVFSLKFLSQNYNTLKGKLTVMKKQCLVNGVSSPSLHGPSELWRSSRRQHLQLLGNYKYPHITELSKDHTQHLSL